MQLSGISGCVKERETGKKSVKHDGIYAQCKIACYPSLGKKSITLEKCGIGSKLT